MEVVEILRAAREAVDRAEIPDELKSVAFVKAVELYSTGPRTHLNGRHESEAQGGNSVAAISTKLGLEESLLNNVYDLAENTVTVVIPRSRFPQQKGPATKALALILAAGRQAAGYDDGWTPTEVIRQHCSDFGIFDSGHFAQTISDLDDVLILRGKGLKREVKVTQGGYEEAARQVRRLVEGE